MKTCTTCHEEKPLSDFHKDRRQRFGRRPECKVCGSLKGSYLLKSLRQRLNRRWYVGINNFLTITDIEAMPHVCYFCKEPIVYGVSLHRLDHRGHYTISNVVKAHKSCHAKFGGHQSTKRKG